MEKTMKARVQHKHDIEANWLKATNFTPLASEIIVYDPDENYDYPRIKIGDGKTNINALPFVTKDYAKISDIPTKPQDIGALPDSTVIPTVPTKISAFENDKGYLTQHQSLDAYAKTADLGALATKDSLTASDVGALPDTTKIPGALSDLSEDTTHRVVTDAEKEAWNAKSNFSGNYADLNGKPTIPTVPTKISAFENDAKYLTTFTETDPTVPDWAKAKEKPTYTADEVGALPDSTEIPSKLSDLSEDTAHRLVTDAEKTTWNAKSNFSGSYNDLTNKPTIPSVAGLASTTYVDNAVKNKVDKDGNKVLSTNDYTTAEKNKLAGIAAGAEVNVNADWNATSGDAQILNKPTLGSMAAKSSVAKSDLASEIQTSLGKADSALQPGDISDWAKQSSKPSYTKNEVGLGNVDNTSDANKPVSTAQANAIAEAKKAGTDAQSNLNTHTNNKSNPHGVTKAQVGLGNVDNVRQYSASNPPPYPVTSINGKTGAVVVDIPGSYTIPSFWQSAIDTAIATIKSLQTGKNCVTFPFFSDNHTRYGYAGILIAEVMKQCHIPYCFYGGDSISSGYIASEAVMIEQDGKFDAMMSAVPNGRMCRAVGNHDGYWAVSANERHQYTREQVYELFLREESIAQSKHFGDDGTYYYVEDMASKIRFIVLNTNGNRVDDIQIAWFRDVALKVNEGWAVVIISHHPISNHYHANISNAAAVRAIVIESGAEVIGWFSGHIHRDRIYNGAALNTSDDSIGDDMGFKQITITSDATNIAYEDTTRHPIAEDALSHAIDFVTINRDTKTVNLTRLGIGNNRVYNYEGVVLYSITSNLNNVISNNKTTFIRANQSYTTSLTALGGYTLSSVKVTMGGTDITSSVYNNGVITIAEVTGDVVITASAEKPAEPVVNIWQTPYKLNSRLNTSETDPDASGVFISAWYPVSQEQLSGDIVLRSNKNIFNHANLSSSGDYLRFYSSTTAGTALLSEIVDRTSKFTKAYDSENGIYSLTIKHTWFSSKASEIKYFRWCAQVSTSAITADYFDGCILTVNQEITNSDDGSYTNLADPSSADWLTDKRFATSSISDFAGVYITNYIPCKPGDTIRVKGMDLNSLISSSKPRTRMFSNGTQVGIADYYPNYIMEAGYGSFNSETGISTFRLVNMTQSGVVDGNEITEYTFDSIRINFKLLSGYTVNDVIVTVNEEISGKPSNGESNYTNLADPTSSEWKIGYRVNSSLNIVETSGDTNQQLTNIIPLSGNNQFHIKGMGVYDELSNDGSNYNRVILMDSNGTILAAAQLDSNSFRGYYTVADYDSAVAVVDVTSVIAKANKTGVAFVRFGGRVTDPASVIITIDQRISDDPDNGTSYINQIPISTDTDGSIYNGKGYKEGTRISSSSGSISANDAVDLTGFIPIKLGDVVRMKNIDFVWATMGSAGGLHFYAADKTTKVRSFNTNELPDIAATFASDAGAVYDNAGNLVQFTITNYGGMNTAAFMRVCATNIDDSSIITINQEITINPEGDSSEINLADPSADGWVNNSRLSSSGEDKGEGGFPGGVVTNWIYCERGDVLRISGIDFGTKNNASNTTAPYIQCYYTSGDMSCVDINSYEDTGGFEVDENGVVTFLVLSWDGKNQAITSNGQVEKVRFSGLLTAANANDVVITKNQSI